jgi:hypothetical protein
MDKKKYESVNVTVHLTTSRNTITGRFSNAIALKVPGMGKSITGYAKIAGSEFASTWPYSAAIFKI